MKQIAVTLFLILCTVLPLVSASQSAQAIDKNIWTDSDGVVLEYVPMALDELDPDTTDELDPDSMDEEDESEDVNENTGEKDEIEGVDVNEGGIETTTDPTYSISPDVAQIPVDIEDTAAGTLPLDSSGTLPLDSTDKRDEGEGADGNERDEIDESVSIGHTEQVGDEHKPSTDDAEHATDPADDIDDTL